MYCNSFHRDGTTDVTRTVHFGTPSEYERVSNSLCQYHFNFLKTIVVHFDCTYTDPQTVVWYEPAVTVTYHIMCIMHSCVTSCFVFAVGMLHQSTEGSHTTGYNGVACWNKRLTDRRNC